MEGRPRVTRDCFICHASEDKGEVAQPLAEALEKRGYRVWFDEFELDVGDSLSEAIDEGLAASRFGVVVLSATFFEKKWTSEPRCSRDRTPGRSEGGVRHKNAWETRPRRDA